MPGLVACGRRWGIGSDDLLCPASVELFVRTVWLCGIIAVFIIHRDSLHSCANGQLLILYYIGLLALLSLHMITGIAEIYISAQGSIMDVEARRHMAGLLYFRAVLYCLEVMWSVVGTYWAFREKTSACERDVVIAVKVAVISSWLILFALLVALLIVFDPLGSADLEDDGEAVTTASAKLWKLRCNILCCCVRGDAQTADAFEDIAQVFANFFKGVDIVPTDIAVGLILLHASQKKHRRSTHMVSINPPTNDHLTVPTTPPQRLSPSSSVNITAVGSASLTQTDQVISIPDPVAACPSLTSITQPAEWMTTKLTAHYMRFAAACYGWLFYVCNNPTTGLCGLYGHCSCCCCKQTGLGYVLDDNCCGGNRAAILRMTDIDNDDIIYASFYNRVYEIPFYVAMDHKHHAVVIAVRGTLSFRDAITDLAAHSECLEVEEVGAGRAHKGMLQAACYIKSTLENMQLLQTAFQKAGPDYRLVITGHSLGAGVAALLAVLLKPLYPSLICFAFSPPCLVSLPLSQQMQKFVLSVVVGRDMVARLGIASVEHLKIQLLTLIRDAKKPKYQLLALGCLNALRRASIRKKSEEDGLLVHTRPLAYHTESHVSAALQSIDDAIATMRQHSNVIRLYVPGRIFYLEQEEPVILCNPPTYKACWAHAEMFGEIQVSPHMVVDHLPDVVLRALDQLADQIDVPCYVAQP